MSLVWTGDAGTRTRRPAMATDLGKTKQIAPGKNECFVEEQITRTRRRIRLLDICSSLLIFVGVTFAFALVVASLDLSQQLSQTTRQLLFFGYAAASAVFLGVGLVWPLCQRINPYYSARQLDQTLPGSKNSVVNWLDLRDQNLPQAIRGAVGARAAKDLQKADMERAVSVRRALWLGGLCFILAIAILLFMFSTGTRFWSL